MVVKTAISLPENVFKRVNKEARKRKMSRSRLIATLLEEHWSRLKEDELVARINAAYANHEVTEEERVWLDFGLQRMAEATRDDEW